MSPTAPPTVGAQAPTFATLLCDGEMFRPTGLDDALDGGAVLVFYGFTFSAIAENWWKQYARRGWDGFDVPVLGVSRDGPYAQNRFIREMDLPFDLFADVNGTAVDAYGLSTTREGMAGVETARRAIFVLDADQTVSERWLADDWISPPPVAEIEAAVEEL
ncbi:MAG: peroxiredoxin family protein [Halolamina sp.]